MVLTSKESIKALINSGVSMEGVEVVCVSQKTAQYAKKMGAVVKDYANGYGKELFAIIESKYRDKKIFFPHAKVLAYDMVSQMQKAGIFFEECCVYETQCSPKKEINFHKDDIVIFTSPSTVECFINNYGLIGGMRVVVIGETTKKALPKGVEVYSAKVTTIESCIEKARSL